MAFKIQINSVGMDIQKANRNHKCSFCKDPIEKGIKYVLIAVRDEPGRYPKPTKYHQKCFKKDIIESSKRFSNKMIKRMEEIR